VVVQVAGGHGDTVDLGGNEGSHLMSPNRRASSGRAGPTYSNDIVSRSVAWVFDVRGPGDRPRCRPWPHPRHSPGRLPERRLQPVPNVGRVAGGVAVGLACGLEERRHELTQQVPQSRPPGSRAGPPSDAPSSQGGSGGGSGGPSRRPRADAGRTRRSNTRTCDVLHSYSDAA
jgi:hypothetical protein